MCRPVIASTLVHPILHSRVVANTHTYTHTMFTREHDRPLQAGHGAVFWVDIPYVPANEDATPKEPTPTLTGAPEQRPQTRPSQESGVPGIQLRVLLVEDCIMIQVRPTFYKRPGQHRVHV